MLLYRVKASAARSRGGPPRGHPAAAAVVGNSGGSNQAATQALEVTLKGTDGVPMSLAMAEAWRQAAEAGQPGVPARQGALRELMCRLISQGMQSAKPGNFTSPS